MNNLKVFDFKGNEVRSLMIDDEPYFVGKDVATVLGYQNTRDALSKRVEQEDKKDGVAIYDSIGREQKVVVINESGLYALILSSKLPTAKEFKHWVTSEVLPSIRKTGTYGNYQPKATSAGEVASLIKPVISVMNKQGSKPYKVAEQVELTLNQFGIATIPEFVEKTDTKVKQLTIAFIEE